MRLDGSTKDRAGVVAGFQDPNGPPVMLLSLKAGGVGLTLTAADHVYLLDPWWNPAVEEQAADRAHRIGQENPVLIHRLVADGTVEDRILKLQEKKREIARAALARVGMSDFAATRVDRLSGGEKQKVAVARALAQGAKLILADEPTAALDSTFRSSVPSLTIRPVTVWVTSFQQKSLSTKTVPSNLSSRLRQPQIC
jgi:predicted ABC-type transport system involved in lysophospholipase L1 biosynthesis ATPase subunit